MTRLCWQSAWRVTKSLSRQGCAPGTLRARQRKELLPKSRRHSHHTHFAHCCSQLRPPQTLTAHGRLGLRCHTMHEAGELQNAKAGAKGHQRKTTFGGDAQRNSSVWLQGTKTLEEEAYGRRKQRAQGGQCIFLHATSAVLEGCVTSEFSALFFSHLQNSKGEPVI